jgi:hypothetical protein
MTGKEAKGLLASGVVGGIGLGVLITVVLLMPLKKIEPPPPSKPKFIGNEVGWVYWSGDTMIVHPHIEELMKDGWQLEVHLESEELLLHLPPQEEPYGFD